MAKGKSKQKKARAADQGGGGKGSRKLGKAGKKALELAQQPVVSEIVAAALLAAANALRDGKGAKGKQGALGNDADRGSEGKAGGGLISGDLGALALTLARQTLDSWERKSARKKGGETQGDASRES